MADVTTVDATRGFAPAPGGLNIVALEFTKANATDTFTVPAMYGTTVVWCDIIKKSSQVKDPATAVDGRKVTLSVGTGAMVGLFLLI